MIGWKVFLTVLVLHSVSQALLEEPQNCIEAPAESSCVVKSQSKPVRLQLGDQSFRMGAETVVEREAGAWRLLSGEVWLNSEKSVRWSTSFVSLVVEGQVWVRQFPKKTSLRNLSGQSQFYSKMNSTEIVIPVGFESWVGGPSQKKEVSLGVVRPIVMKDFLPSIVSTFKLGRQATTEQVLVWQQDWKSNVEKGSELYSEAIQRHMASIQEQQERANRRKAQQQQEDLELRKMFRKKNGLEGL